MAQVVEHLPVKCKAPISKPQTQRGKNPKNLSPTHFYSLP
jgi:hypothetical protein